MGSTLLILHPIQLFHTLPLHIVISVVTSPLNTCFIQQVEDKDIKIKVWLKDFAFIV